jgi:hypothetical protein
MILHDDGSKVRSVSQNKSRFLPSFVHGRSSVFRRLRKTPVAASVSSPLKNPHVRSSFDVAQVDLGSWYYWMNHLTVYGWARMH